MKIKGLKVVNGTSRKIQQCSDTALSFVVELI